MHKRLRSLCGVWNLLPCSTSLAGRPTAVRDARLILAQASDGLWTIQAPEGEEMPPSLASVERGSHKLSVAGFYPRQPDGCCPPPDTQVVRLVRAGMAHILRHQLALCSPLPSGPIDGDAFLLAGFDWAVRAAADRTTTAKLAALCQDVALPLGREALKELRNTEASQHNGVVRIAAEMTARFPERPSEDPLLAVHLLTWITATSLVFRGFNWPLPFIWQESEMLETALALQEVAPRLLEHDITKVCLIQALVSAKARTEVKPEPTDGETECHSIQAS